MKNSMLARREAARKRLRSYVAVKVVPALGESGAFDLVVAPEGTRSIVLFLRVGGKRYVIKAHENVASATRILITTRHMVRHDVPVPRILFADLSPVTRLRHGAVFLVDEAIEGGDLATLERTEERLAAAGRALGRMHRVTRGRFGAPLPGLARRTDYFRFLQGRLNRRLDDLARSSAEFSAVADPIVREWFARQELAATPPGGFSLCHLRVSDSNVLFGPTGEAYLIDVVTARYAHPAIDLERALYRWCNDDPRLSAAFLSAYFATFTGYSRTDWERQRDYHRASFHVTQIYRAAKEYRRFIADDNRRKTRRRRRTVTRHAHELLAVLTGALDAPPKEALDGLARRIRAQVQGARRVDSQMVDVKPRRRASDTPRSP